jgi:hypothetical protein
MKRIITFPVLSFLMLAAIATSTQASSAVVPDLGPSAFGQGEFSFLSEHWIFSFDVKANKHGRATGRAVFDILRGSTQSQVVVKINCLDVVGPTGFASALMTGTVLHSDDPEFPKGAKVVFGAEDNSASPFLTFDIVTRLFVLSLDGDCHDGFFPLTLFFLSLDAIHIEQ